MNRLNTAIKIHDPQFDLEAKFKLEYWKINRRVSPTYSTCLTKIMTGKTSELLKERLFIENMSKTKCFYFSTAKNKEMDKDISNKCQKKEDCGIINTTQNKIQI